MSVSSAIPLALIGLAYLFYDISRSEQRHEMEKWAFFILCLITILASIVTMARLAEDDSLTAIQQKLEEFFAAFIWVLYLYLWVWFIAALIMAVNWWNKLKGRGPFR